MAVKATLYWKSRNEMLVKKGAIMMEEAPLNKDGSVSYAAKYGDKLRADHQENISDNKTTADIILKSVNEVSLLTLLWRDKQLVGSYNQEWEKSR